MQSCKQEQAREHRPQGVYTGVHDQGDADRNELLRRKYAKPLRKVTSFCPT